MGSVAKTTVDNVKSTTARRNTLVRRLNDAGDARCHLVLKFEDIFERALEMVSPEMRTGERVDSCAVMRTRLAALRTEPSRT
jgi:hypothetical protein